MEGQVRSISKNAVTQYWMGVLLIADLRSSPSKTAYVLGATTCERVKSWGYCLPTLYSDAYLRQGCHRATGPLRSQVNVSVICSR